MRDKGRRRGAASARRAVLGRPHRDGDRWDHGRVRKWGVIAIVGGVGLLVAASSAIWVGKGSAASAQGSSTRRVSQDVDGVHFLTPDVGWATEDNDTRMVMTTDGGSRWRDVSPPLLLRHGWALASGLSGGSFLSRSDFFVSVYDSSLGHLVPQYLFHSTDGGRRWVRIGSFPDGAGQAWVTFLNDRRGWVAVGNGAAGGSSSVTVYETTSAGAHWSVVSRSMSLTGRPGTPDNPGNCGDTGLSTSGASHAPVLWLTGASNFASCVYRSTDGGKRWTSGGLVDPSRGWGGEAWSPVFSTDSRGSLVAWRGTPRGSVAAFYSTSNGGRTWVERRLPSSTSGPVDVVSATTWVMAAGTKLYLSINGGFSWSSVPTTLDFSGPSMPGSLAFVNAMSGWAIDGSSQLWHTTNGGHTWALEQLPG